MTERVGPVHIWYPPCQSMSAASRPPGSLPALAAAICSGERPTDCAMAECACSTNGALQVEAVARMASSRTCGVRWGRLTMTGIKESNGRQIEGV